MPRCLGPVFSVTGYLVWNAASQCFEVILDDDQTQTVVFRQTGLCRRWLVWRYFGRRVTVTGHLWGDWDMLAMKVRRVG